MYNESTLRLVTTVNKHINKIKLGLHDMLCTNAYLILQKNVHVYAAHD